MQRPFRAFSRRLSLLFLCLLAVLTGCSDGSGSSPSADPPGLVAVETFEGGVLYRTVERAGSGGFDVLVLSGSWRQMGRQYGHLCRARFADLSAVAMSYLTSKGVTAREIAAGAETHYQEHMDYVKQMVQGMAETSGMGLEQQKIQNYLMYPVVLTFGCSSMDAWGAYTGGGPVVSGRNWDIGPHINAFNRFLQVVVYNPAGAIPVADVNYLGLFMFQSGMNKSGIFLDLQNGQMADDATRSDVPDSNDYLFTLLTESSTLGHLDAKFRDNRADGGFVINAADATGGRVYEWATYGTRIRNGNGLVASTNHYIDPTWEGGPRVPADGEAGGFTKERLANLLAIGEAYKGRLDAPAMMEIFDKTIDQGGPTFAGGRTVHQIVAIPAERTIWLKATDYSGWQPILLGPLFH